MRMRSARWRAVECEAMVKGAEAFGIPLNEHIRFCLDALLPHAEE